MATNEHFIKVKHAKLIILAVMFLSLFGGAFGQFVASRSESAWEIQMASQQFRGMTWDTEEAAMLKKLLRAYRHAPRYTIHEMESMSRLGESGE